MPDTSNKDSVTAMVWQGFESMQLIPKYENGVATVPALLLNGSTTVNVTLSGTFPDTNYLVKIRAISGAAILSMLQVTNVVKTANSVSVTVKANGLASLAGILLVDAYRV